MPPTTAQDPVEPQALRRAAEVLSEVLRDAQRRLAEEAVDSAVAREEPGSAKPEPVPFVDLTPYEGMEDRDVLLALGARKSDVSYYKKALERDRRAEALHRSRGEHRCEAGIPASLGLRCTLAALPGERWCRRHHPSPPAGAMTPVEEVRARLRRDQLWQRPDGRVIEAVYELTDSVDELCAATREVLDRAQRMEAAVADGKAAAWLDIEEAATYARRSRSAVARAANRGELSGVRESARGPWSFRPTDLDQWLESGDHNTGRYMSGLSPSARRSVRRRY